MLENGTLELAEIEGTNYYRLTEKGIEGAEKFKKLVPKSFRDKIYAAGLRLFVKLKNDRDVSFDIKPAKRGYNVHCRCCDDDMVLMDITLYAPDQEQANYIKSKIQMNPTDFYCRVVDYIIENEEYVPSGRRGQDCSKKVGKSSMLRRLLKNFYFVTFRERKYLLLRGDQMDVNLKNTPSEIDRLIDKYKSTVYGIAIARLGSKADADDVFQEVFLTDLSKRDNSQDNDEREVLAYQDYSQSVQKDNIVKLAQAYSSP